LKSPNQDSWAKKILNLSAIFNNLTLCCQNVNSLNVSTKCPKQSEKIAAITGTGADIIFLSDVRLSKADIKDDIAKFFLLSTAKQYQSFFNSTGPRRGVGILVSKQLDYTVDFVMKDKTENIIGVFLSFGQEKVGLIGIYGPNTNDMNFFQDLDKMLERGKDYTLVLGGDWNLTYSTGTGTENIDIFNMNNAPSQVRSMRLQAMCERRALVDPYRAISPEARDYTYVPRTQGRNRSRLDFFLISLILLDIVEKCEISPGLLSNLFDHKLVKLNFEKPTFSRKKMVINNDVLDHEIFESTVLGVVTDTYLQHIDRAANRDFDIDHLLTQTGRFMQTCREYNDKKADIYLNGQTDLRDMELAGKKRDLDEQSEGFLSPENLDQLVLTANPDVFLEVLVNNIKNGVYSLQQWEKKISSQKVKNLKLELQRLKEVFPLHEERIFEIESTLTQIETDKIKARVAGMKLFEGLHSEKPTPIFLQLVKKRSKDRLAKIRREDGTDFPSEKERIDYIVNSYEDIYRKDPNEPVDYQHVIEEFLGPSVLDNAKVKNSKLTAAEANTMECPISVAELDKAMAKANLKSAPGIDGFSNKFLKKIWKWLRLPLTKYANFCFETGELTHNFRCATIRLIPKKGCDPSKLKSWRPISLLSNLYKVISRALNSRLQKINDRICSRAQKGFTGNRYVQEALINVWEKLAACKANQSSGAVVAVDMAKAYDTISNAFMEATLKFFGFGPTMIKWLKLTGTNRTACLLLDGNVLSRFFSLDRGRPQGDITSPITFNFCVQILIFKIEFDTSIASLPNPINPNRAPVANEPDPALAPPEIPAADERLINGTDVGMPGINPDFFVHEMTGECEKNESMADDNTTVTLLEDESLRSLKKVIDDFGIISGLRCNENKSSVLPTKILSDERKNHIGKILFPVVEKFKLLGVEITRTADNEGAIFNRIYEKILKLISFWERFRLSLPGRIIIAKTFLLSQLGYIGCFLPIPDESLKITQSIIDNFIRKNENIATEKIYRSPEQGGLGFFRLKDFLIAQKVSWFCRAWKLPIDTWRRVIKNQAPKKNVILARPEDISKVHNPICYSFVESFKIFYGIFTETNSNYKCAYIYDNPSFTIGPDTSTTITIERLGVRGNTTNLANFRALTYDKCFHGTSFKTRDQFAESGVVLTPAAWFRLQLAISTAGRRLTKIAGNPESEKVLTIETFFKKLKRGSKAIHNFFRKKYFNEKDLLREPIVVTFCRLTELVPVIEREVGNDNNIEPVPGRTITLNEIKVGLSMWDNFCFENDFREFSYKARHNSLWTNRRLYAAGLRDDPFCTFCKIRFGRTQSNESFLHLFKECLTTSSLITTVRDGIDNINEVNFTETYFFGLTVNGQGEFKTDMVILLFWELFRYRIWKKRCQRVVPNGEQIKKEIAFALQGLSNLSRKWKTKLLNSAYVEHLFVQQG